MAQNQKKSKFTLDQKFNRTFSVELKKRIVSQVTQKQMTITQACALHNVSRQSIYNWIYTYSTEHKAGTKMIVQSESEQKKTQKVLERNAELERIIGQKQLEIDYLSKLIELCNKELGIDVKKNFEAKPLNGSEKTKKNIHIP